MTEHEHNPSDDDARRARAAELREQIEESRPDDEAEPDGADDRQHLTPREFTERSVNEEREEQED